MAGQRRGTFIVPTADIATTRVAQRGANFLEIGVGARAQGLGYAGTAMVSGATASYWNPAGLATLDGVTMAFTRSNLYDDLDITHSFGSVGIAFAGGGAMLSYIRLDSGDIPRSNEDDPGADAITEGRFYEFAGTALGLSYGRRLTDRLQVGVTGRMISEGLDRAQASWWGLDFGTLFNTGLYGITLGAALTNIGSSAAYEGTLITNRVTTREAFAVNLPVRYNTTPYQLPTAFRFAVMTDLIGGADALFGASGNHSFRMAVDLNDATDTDLQMALGAEYNFRNMIFLRGGKKFVNEALDDFRSFSDFLSFGGGLRLPILGRRLGFDYAFTSMGELQNIQTFSFEFGN
jgi:hypothetical protein